MKNDDILQRSNKGFPCEPGSPNYIEKLTFSALIKYIFKRLQTIRFHVPKTSFQYI